MLPYKENEKEKEKKLEAELKVGPLSILQQSVENHSQVLISLRNNRKLLGRVHSFDRHMNLILENVREMWKDTSSKAKKKKKGLLMDRFISKMFLRGDSIILVVKNPNTK